MLRGWISNFEIMLINLVISLTCRNFKSLIMNIFLLSNCSLKVTVSYMQRRSIAKGGKGHGTHNLVSMANDEILRLSCFVSFLFRFRRHVFGLFFIKRLEDRRIEDYFKEVDTLQHTAYY